MPPSSEPNKFGELLKKFRTLRGIKQAALAEKVGLSAHTVIGDYERGRRTPKGENLHALIKALDLEADEADALLSAAVLEGQDDDSVLLRVADPDTAEMVRAFEGLPEGIRRAQYELIMESARRFRQERPSNTIGRRSDQDDNPTTIAEDSA